MQCWLHAAGHLCFASHKRLHWWSTITMLFHSEITSAISGYLPPGNRHLHLAAAPLLCHSVGFHRLGLLTVQAPHFRLASISTSQPQTLPSDCVWVAMGPTLCSRNLLAQGAVITFRQCHWILQAIACSGRYCLMQMHTSSDHPFGPSYAPHSVPSAKD